MSGQTGPVYSYEKSHVSSSGSSSSSGSFFKSSVHLSSNKRQFIICNAGIFITYLVYGVLQENILKSEYGESKERYTYTLVLVFAQCLVHVLFAQTAIKTQGGHVESSPRVLFIIMSLSYVGAMLASNDALRYVSYPTQVLGKSMKPIPVMILGVLLARKKYPYSKYMYVLMIVLGVAMFMYKPKKNISPTNQDKVGGISVGYGELLLLVSLLLDGVTGGVQDKIRSQHKIKTHTMMLHMNLWSSLFLFIGLIVTGELVSFIGFASRHPWIIFQLLTFSICSAVGQNFIFMTITNFGPLPCSIITTTRKFFTILLSVVIFRNPLSWMQWSGTILVFLGLSFDAFFGKKNDGGKS
ncbi:hypothetical protein HELRODRAFT_85944 [Helobdella robusta]|uniref:Sugar phosphate transporter domain-containing protein n=1 Tax=Helobdella robusta TaxID=6412 RepID=T1G648_HELRO|nr:hypothetical protein HELRODRAFT_85944 [Helobdella robusta]ESN96954.1 hypothetical protein HELRODRAFT_85944 [Helobdella robusta]